MFDSRADSTRDTSGQPLSSGELSSSVIKEKTEKKRPPVKQQEMQNKSTPRTQYVVSIGLTRSDFYSKLNWLEKQSIVEQEVEAARLQALKELGDVVEEVFKSFKGTPDVFNIAVSLAPNIYKAFQKGVSLEKTKEVLQQKAQALQKEGVVFSHRPQQEISLQPLDLSEIPPYQGRRGRPRRGQPREVTALDFLKTHYGQWLSAFGAEQDSVFQDQIRAHDPKLMQGVRNQLHEEGRGRKVSDFVKTRSARVDRELQDADPEYLRKAHREASRLKMAAKRRELKSKSSPKPL